VNKRRSKANISSKKNKLTKQYGREDERRKNQARASERRIGKVIIYVCSQRASEMMDDERQQYVIK
jgi:hypothetical protein